MSGKVIQDSMFAVERQESPDLSPILEVKRLCYGSLLNDVSFSVFKGEIFGVTGLVGAGKSELLKCLYGLYEKTSGDIIHHKKNEQESDSIQFGFVPEDRKREGLFLNLDIVRNISISSLRGLSKFSWVNKRKEAELAEKSVRDLDIKAAGIRQQVQFLSGGNQQKVILSRWLGSGKSILLLDEPTRGVDVLAKTEIYKLIHALSGSGITVIFSSSDVTEVLVVCDRIAAFRNGRLVSTYARENFDKEKILHDIMFDQ